jgi:hypothetical protein
VLGAISIAKQQEGTKTIGVNDKRAARVGDVPHGQLDGAVNEDHVVKS